MSKFIPTHHTVEKPFSTRSQNSTPRICSSPTQVRSPPKQSQNHPKPKLQHLRHTPAPMVYVDPGEKGLVGSTKALKFGVLKWTAP